MFQTKITEMFGTKYPIVVGTMMHLARAEMVAAASNAGALGVLASVIFQTKDEFRREIKKLRDLTDKPFAVNLNLFPIRNPIDIRQYMEVIFEEGIKIVETSGHKAPEEIAGELKAHGVILVHKCVGVRYALKAQSVGVNAVTVVGCENGGATGTLDVTTLCLVPRVVDALKVPVIGGGGVADGRGLLALLALGAQGVIIGTATLVAEECPIHPRLKQALIDATEVDTMVVMRSIQNSHRVWINECAKNVADLEKKGAGLETVVEAAGGTRQRGCTAKGISRPGSFPAGRVSASSRKSCP